MKSKIKKRKVVNDNDVTFAPWRRELKSIIFGSETTAGRLFDIILIISIICSVIAVMLNSVDQIHREYGYILFYIEWFFTLLFTFEYILRIICVRHPMIYARSFFGIVDFLSIIPTYLIFLFPSLKYMAVIRILRLLRVFRILKLAAFMGEANILMGALSSSLRKILVFLYAILTLVVIFGSLMYVVEGSEAGFTSIPKSVYWAIVTLTTVGYGDIAPLTPLGQMIASCIMIMGYGIIAVPTGIYSAELIKTIKPEKISNIACSSCGETGHDYDADFCKFCGHQIKN